jgi:hypothetical protein
VSGIENSRFADAPASPGPFRDPRIKGAIGVAVAFVALGVAVFAWRVGHVVSAVKTQFSEAEKANRRTVLKNQLKELGVQF